MIRCNKISPYSLDLDGFPGTQHCLPLHSISQHYLVLFYLSSCCSENNQSKVKTNMFDRSFLLVWIKCWHSCEHYGSTDDLSSSSRARLDTQVCHLCYKQTFRYICSGYKHHQKVGDKAKQECTFSLNGKSCKTEKGA